MGLRSRSAAAVTQTEGAPRTLRELRMWTVAGDGLEAALATACEVLPLTPRGWESELRDSPGHLLVVEGGDRLPDAWDPDALDRLLERCERMGVPRLLWITASPYDRAYLDRCARFDRVFSVDRGHLRALEQAGARLPAMLPPATGLPVDDRPVPGTSARHHAVAWAGGWSERWPERWREGLVGIMRAAAPHGLVVSGIPAPESLPPELRGHVVAADGGDPARLLRDARVAIAADPVTASPRVAPPGAFDAIACGAAAISPHGEGMALTGLWFEPPADRPEAASMRRRLVPVVSDRESAARAIEELLGDDGHRERTVHRCRRTVFYNHTYGNRAATLASAVGHRLAPDVPAHPTPA